MPPPLRPVSESVRITTMQRNWLRVVTDVITSNLLLPHDLWILAETSLGTLFVVAEQALHIVEWQMELCEREAQELEQRRREEELRLQEAARSRVRRFRSTRFPELVYTLEPGEPTPSTGSSDSDPDQLVDFFFRFGSHRPAKRSFGGRCKTRSKSSSSRTMRGRRKCI